MNTFLPALLWGFGIEMGAAPGRGGTHFNAGDLPDPIKKFPPNLYNLID